MQSHRGIIERRFAHLKMFEILQGGSCDSIEIKEKELDAAMALCNLQNYQREKRMQNIPERPPFVEHSHIITKDYEDVLNCQRGRAWMMPTFL